MQKYMEMVKINWKNKQNRYGCASGRQNTDTTEHFERYQRYQHVSKMLSNLCMHTVIPFLLLLYFKYDLIDLRALFVEFTGMRLIYAHICYMYDLLFRFFNYTP